MNYMLAYLDPGSGAMIVQVIIAAMLGTGFFFRRLLLAPFSMFRRRGDDENQ